MVPISASSTVGEAKLLMTGLASFANTEYRNLDTGLFRQCMDERLTSWLSGRSFKEVERSIANAGVDWDPLFHRLFLKSQLVKKLPKAHANASKGQIVTDVSHVKLFRDDVWGLYLERSLMRRLRKGVYLHTRKNFTDMNAWYKENWEPGPVTYCDYTGWDTGVNESFTLFYAEFMRRNGVPAQVVKRFMHERHNSRNFLGPTPAMQASGDRFTWLHNTLGNMALTGHSFDLPSDVPAGFSGDDMILAGEYHRHDDVFRQFLPKVHSDARGEFCGYMFGGPTLYVAPNVLLHRVQMGIEGGRSDRDFWDSVDLTLRYSDDGSFYESQEYAAVAEISVAARRLFNLPTSRFPVQLRAL